MELKEAVISNFSKGMIEVIEAGQSFDNGYQAPSVKYLENLDPNVVEGALVKRRSYTSFPLNQQSSSPVFGLPYGSERYLDAAGRNYITPAFPHKFVINGAGNYLDCITGAIVSPAIVSRDQSSGLNNMAASQYFLGMGRFDMRNPTSGNVYFVFFRDDQFLDGAWRESTSINGFYFSKILQQNLQIQDGEAWINPLYDPAFLDWSTTPLPTSRPYSMRGQRINGIVQDWVNVGQALYVVSIPDVIDGLLPASPTYRWAPVLDPSNTKLPSVFPDAAVVKTYYMISSESQINVNASAIATPFKSGHIANHPQYKGTTTDDVMYDENLISRTEVIDYDGLKNSVDILWWQTDKLPDMKDLAGKDIGDILITHTKADSNNKLTNIMGKMNAVTLLDTNWSGRWLAEATDATGDTIWTTVPSVQSSTPGYNAPQMIMEGVLPELVNYDIQLSDSGSPFIKADLVEYATCPIPTNRTDPASMYLGHWGDSHADHTPDRLDIQTPVGIAQTLRHNGSGDQIWPAPLTDTSTVAPFEYWYSVKEGGIVRYYKVNLVHFSYRPEDPKHMQCTTTNQSWTLDPSFSVSWMRGDLNIDGSIWFFAPKASEIKEKQIYMPDYKAAQVMRFWHEQAQIPYLVTAIVDGVEILLHQDEYRTFYGNTEARLTQGTFTDVPIYFTGTNIQAFMGKVLIPDDTVASIRQFNSNTLNNQAPFVCFTLRINVDHDVPIQTVLPTGLTSFRLYVSYPDNATSVFFDTEGNTWSPGSYTKPAVKDINSKAYGLVKEFLVYENDALQADGSENDFATYNFGDQGNRALAHGKWAKFPDTPFIDQSANTPQLIDGGGSGYYYIPWEHDTFTLNPTPDFYLWDYASGPAVTSNLGVGAIPWDGIGARCITQVSNRIVIGGTIDKNGSEEVGRIRAAMSQGTAMLNTSFAELDALDVSSTPIEALVNFRNDLWVFSRNNIVRISPANPYSMPTWQIVDTITGQGILHKKHLIATPAGIYFANPTGIWFVDGSGIKNIAEAVMGTFKYIFNNSSNWQSYNSYSLRPDTLLTTGFINDSFELSYDAYVNEIVASVAAIRGGSNLAGMPSGYTELQLRYNISRENFRIETRDLPNTMNVAPTAFSRTNRVKFNDFDSRLVHPLIYNRFNLTWFKQMDNVVDQLETPIFYDWSSVSLGVTGVLSNVNNNPIQYWYAGIVSLYSIGNGMDDALLRQVIVEITPIEHNIQFANSAPVPIPPIQWTDPRLFIEYRNREQRVTSSPQIPALPFPVAAGKYDLVALNTRNIAPGNLLWSHINTPISIAWSRESMVLNTPLDAKFRRVEATLVTTSLTYLKSFRFKFAQFKRKTLG